MTAFETFISLLNEMGIDNIRLVASQKDKVISLAIYVNGKQAYSPVVGSGSMQEVEAMIPDMVAEIKKTTTTICNTDIYVKNVKKKEEDAKAKANEKKTPSPTTAKPATPVVAVKTATPDLFAVSSTPVATTPAKIQEDYNEVDDEDDDDIEFPEPVLEEQEA